MNRLMSFRALSQHFGILNNDDAEDIYIRSIRKIISLVMASAVMIDEEWYRSQYPDVADAIDAGKFGSARDHFVEHGYFEGRLPGRLKVDEAWYTAAYEDVALGIEEGEITSAEEHFNTYGYQEGRWPVRSPAIDGGEAFDRAPSAVEVVGTRASIATQAS